MRFQAPYTTEDKEGQQRYEIRNGNKRKETCCPTLRNFPCFLIIYSAGSRIVFLICFSLYSELLLSPGLVSQSYIKIESNKGVTELSLTICRPFYNHTRREGSSPLFLRYMNPELVSSSGFWDLPKCNEIPIHR